MIQNQEELWLSTSALPEIEEMGFITAPMDFIHADRVLNFHVFIYVTKGEITVTEKEKDYRIGPGEALFLKAGIRHYGKKKILAGTAWYYIHFRLDQEEIAEEFIPLPVPRSMRVLKTPCVRRSSPRLFRTCRERRQRQSCWNSGMSVKIRILSAILH